MGSKNNEVWKKIVAYPTLASCKENFNPKRAKLSVSESVNVWSLCGKCYTVPKDKTSMAKRPRCFCLRPWAKDQGITWVGVVLLLVLVHHLVHFLFKRNLKEKKFSLTGNLTGVLQLPSQALFSAELIYCMIKIAYTFMVKIVPPMA